MSFTRTRKTVQVGDDVLIYLNPKSMYRVTIKEGDKHQNRYGALNHDDLIGKAYGSQVSMPQGYVHVIDITPDLWTQTLPHRTQILYSTDISMVLMQLDLKPGCVVFEAGTGSGSLSHSIVRTIAPTGHLYTFDFHKERSQIAQAEFEHHGFGHLVTATHRDVCSDGIYDHLKHPQGDAVFLDLPQPWLAIPSAHRALKVGGRICCFSPCIEQIQKSVAALNSLNFKSIKTLENVQFPYEVRKFFWKTFDEESLKRIRAENKERGRQLPKKRRTKYSKPDENENLLEENETEIHSVYMPNQYPGHTGYLLFATKSSI